PRPQPGLGRPAGALGPPLRDLPQLRARPGTGGTYPIVSPPRPRAPRGRRGPAQWHLLPRRLERLIVRRSGPAARRAADHSHRTTHTFLARLPTPPQASPTRDGTESARL